MTTALDWSPSDAVATDAALAIPRRSDMWDILKLLLRGKWTVVASGLVAAAMMLIYLNLATYRYTAEMKVTSAQGSGGGLASSLQKLGGLASIANLQLPQDSGSVAFLRYGEILHSPNLARAVARNESVMHVLFEGEWDRGHARWVEPTGIGSSAIRAVKASLGFPVYAWTPPDASRVQDYLDRWVSVAVDQKRPVITIDYMHRDPAFARDFVGLLHRIADDNLRSRSLARSQQNIDYLVAKLRTVTLAEHLAVLSETLGEQERALMLAQTGASFAADPISDVRISSRPTSPLPGIYLAVAFAGGLLAGGLAVLVRAHRAAQREQLGD